MNTKDLKDKYGGQQHIAINRCIRAELPGGARLLDLIARIAATHQEFTQELMLVRRDMEAEVRRRYDMPPLPDNE